MCASSDLPVQAVVFDIGRVLVRWDMRCLLNKLSGDEGLVEWVFRNVITEEWHFQHDAGRDLAEMVAERKLQFPDFAPFIDAYATRFIETIPGLVPGTPDLVEQLSARGVPLYALTNFAATFWDQFRPTEPLFDHFRDIVVSGVEKIAKPDPAIYRLAERRFGQAPETLLFVDDNIANVEAARACGWQAHHFIDAPLLAAELRQRRLIS